MEQGLQQPDQHTFAELLKFKKGESNLAELSNTLLKTPHMLLLPPSKKLLQEVQAFAASMGIPPEQTFMPDLHGVIHERSFCPIVFTHGKFAYKASKDHGLVQENEDLQTQVMTWSGGLHSFLGRGYGGVIIDDGQEHRVSIDRKQLSRLVALTNLRPFASLPDIGIVTVNGQVFGTSGKDGKTNLFVYDSENACNYGLGTFRANVPGSAQCSIEVMPAADFLKQALGNTFELLVVNYGCPDERCYEFLDLSQLFMSQ